MANARRGGLNAVILLDVTSTAGGSLTTASYFNKYTINMTRNKTAVSSFGDSSEVYVVGLPDQSVQLDGFANVGGSLMQNLLDGKARGMTIIHDNVNNTASTLSGGTYYFDGSVSNDVGGAVTFSLTATPATSGALTAI